MTTTLTKFGYDFAFLINLFQIENISQLEYIMNVTCLRILLSAFSLVQSKLCHESVTYIRFVVLLVLTCGWRGLVLTGLSVVFKGYSLCLLVFQLTLILMSVVFAS